MALTVRPSVMDDFGLFAALRALATRMQATTGLSISVRGNADPEQLSQAIQSAMYRVAQEAINNAIKHAEASKISVEIIIQQQLIITVKDDGKGFDAALQNANGNGLRNYKKRIDHLKGTYTLDTFPGNGTSLQFEIPIS